MSTGTKTVQTGCQEIGFDYSCLIAATNDRVPTVYVENGDVVGLDPADPIEVSYEHNFEGEPTAISHPEMLKMQWAHGHNNSIVNGIPRIGYMKGGQKARWKDEDMADYFVDKVKNFVTEHKMLLSSCIMACMNLTYLVLPTSALWAKQRWGLVAMPSLRQTGVSANCLPT